MLEWRGAVHKAEGSGRLDVGLRRGGMRGTVLS
jgi:hypothetical protein